MQSLELESNNMDTIQKDDFKGLSNRTHLDLQPNGIQRTAKGAFDNLRRLKSIKLSGNNIRKLPGRICQYNTNVSSIAIDQNYMTEFPDLTGITQLTHLRLMRNNIKIVNGYKYGVHQVISIDLALNKIEAFNFTGIRYFELDMGRNRISHIQRGSFGNTLLQNNYFHRTQFLNELHLQGNKLQ